MTDQQKLLARMRDMTRILIANGPKSATEAIQRTLHRDSGVSTATAADDVQKAGPAASPVMVDINAPPLRKKATQDAQRDTASTVTPKASDRGAATPSSKAGATPSARSTLPGGEFVPDLLARLGVALDGSLPFNKTGKPAVARLPEGARFLDATFTNAAGSRHYKLYVPSCYRGQALPLVVMLHGCTQDPDDFAAGTQMNAAAEKHACLVLYPQQSQGANTSRCWNWFNAGDQQRDSGEPSLIAGMTREVMGQYAVDASQVFIAGLSAGGAMATIMGVTYPELFAGVGVHSGLPYGAAKDLPSALAAMKNGVGAGSDAHGSAASRSAFRGIPIIVFHGDADHTVNPRNAEQVIRQAAPPSGRSSTEAGAMPGGHAYTRTVQQDATGATVSEHWLIHGSGHAWAGGSASGSYTDARGPDATGEMMRFFYTQRKST